MTPIIQLRRRNEYMTRWYFFTCSCYTTRLTSFSQVFSVTVRHKVAVTSGVKFDISQRKSILVHETNKTDARRFLQHAVYEDYGNNLTFEYKFYNIYIKLKKKLFVSTIRIEFFISSKHDLQKSLLFTSVLLWLLNEG